MDDDWPGSDMLYRQPAVMVPLRSKSRLRHNSEAYCPPGLPANAVVINGQDYLTLPNGEYVRRQRAASTSGAQERPAQIIINNRANASQYEEDRLSPAPAQPQQQQRRRPSSVVYEDRPLVRVRSRSRPIYDDEEVDIEFDDRRRVVYQRPHHHHRHSRSSSNSSEERRMRGELEHVKEQLAKKHEEEEWERRKQEWARDEEDKKKKPKRSAEDEALLKELADMKKKAELKAEKERLEKELELQQLEKEKKEKARKDEDKKLEEEAIEKYKIKMAEEEAKRKKEEEEQEEHMIHMLMAGDPKMTESKARNFLRRAERNKERIANGREPSEEREEKSKEKSGDKRPIHVKVHSRFLSPDTLDVYELPWEWDGKDPGYIIVKQWIGEREQELLFRHTRELRERRSLTYSRDKGRSEIEQLVIPKKKEEKRKKSPIKRTSWFLT